MPGAINRSQHDEEAYRFDQEKLALERAAVKRLTGLLETGDEEAFVKAIKEWKPDIGQEEMIRLVTAFRAALAEKRGLAR